MIHFRFTDARAGERRWWLVVDQGSADLCRDDPGGEPTLVVESTVLALTEVWTGDRDADEAVARARGARARRGARRAAPCGAGSAAAPSPRRARPAARRRLSAGTPRRCPTHAPPGSRSHPPPGSPSASPSSSSSSPSGRSRPSAASSRKTFLADPLAMVALGLDAAHQDGLRLRHRHDGVARLRRLRHRRGARAAARRGDGRVQADRGLLRALRQLRPLPAGERLHPAAHPLGRHRRGAEARGHLHRLVLPARADDRGDRRQHPARPGRGGLHARRRRPRPDPPRAAFPAPRPRSPRCCARCSAGPGPT